MAASTSYDRNDDEIPFLEEDAAPSTPTPLPVTQVSVLAMLLLAEPIMSFSVLPYINQLVSELPITGGDERSVGYYAGIIISLYFVAETFTVLQWSRISDHVGRKPVLLGGIFGMMIATLLFGLSRTFWTLSASRLLAGALNGNIGVMKSMVAELTDESNMAQGFAVIPVTWAVGATIGPFMGGMLARPRDSWPRLFGSKFWQEYPYFLPCSATGAYAALSLVLAYVFLKETVTKSNGHEKGIRLEEKKVNGYVTEDDGSPEQDGVPTYSLEDHQRPLPLRAVLTRPVLLTISNYGLLAFLEMSVNALVPLVYSTPVEFGGLGMSPARIGACLGAFGIMNGIFQFVCFARIVGRFGLRATYVSCLSCLLPVFLLFPLASLCVRGGGPDFVLGCIVLLQLVAMTGVDMSYACIFMYVATAAPSKRSLGATNGLAQTVASVQRSAGPAIATSLFALSIQRNIMGGYGVFFALTLITIFAIWLATRLPSNTWKSQD